MKKKIYSILLAAVLSTSIAVIPVSAASWQKNSTGWWYQEDNGSYPKNQWKKINGQWYWFNARGYMATGWQKIKGSWYYLQSNGAMLGKGWHWIGGSCYYMYESGAMAANTWIGNSYVNASGAWVKGKVKEQAKWIKSGNRWWYRHADGSYTKNGWEKIEGKWYLFDASGWMLTGWQQKSGKWYYMYESGAMAADTWIGNYYVNSSGVWEKELTHPHNWVTVPAKGHYETKVISAAYDEPMYGPGYIFSDGYTCTTAEEAGDHSVDTRLGYRTGTVQIGTTHHDAVTKQV